MTNEEKLREIVAVQLGVDESEVLPDSTFHQLGADSLDRVDLALTIGAPEADDGLGLEITDDQMEEFTTFGDLVKYVNQLRPDGQSGSDQ